MSRFLAVVFSFIFWCIGTAVILILGPFLWVVIIGRALLGYAAMMLLHAIAGVELSATSRLLEKAITWFPGTLKNLFELLIESLKFPEDRSSPLISSNSSKDPGIQDTLDEILSWIFIQLGPAILVWVPAFFIVRAFGVDLSVVFTESYGPTLVLVWVIFWGSVGLLSIVLMNVIKFIVVAPFVFLVATLWIFIGLVFWFPAMAWGIVEYTNLFFRYALSGGAMSDPSEKLEKAIRYYFNGFSIIGSVLTNPPSVSSVLGKEVSLGSAWKNIGGPLQKRLMSLLLWPGLYVILIWTNTLPVGSSLQ